MAALHTAFPSFGAVKVPEEERDRATLEQLTREASSDARVLVTPESSFVNIAAKPRLRMALETLANNHDVALLVGVAQSAKFARWPWAPPWPKKIAQQGWPDFTLKPVLFDMGLHISQSWPPRELKPWTFAVRRKDQ